MLELCDRNSIAIIGIDGFFLRDGDLHPRLDQIADYSSAVADAWDSFVRICNDSAQAFLQSLCSDSEVVSGRKRGTVTYLWGKGKRGTVTYLWTDLGSGLR